MGTRDAGYTKTGNGWLTSLANKLSFIPFGGIVAAPMIMIDTIINSIGWVFRGKLLSAAATLGSGTVAATSAGFTGSNPIWWGVNVLSGIATGRSINTHVRGFTEGAESLVTKPLGLQPTVLRSYPACIGNGPNMPTQPGMHARMESERRGKNAQDMHDAYMRGEGGVNVAELGSANYAR